MKLACDGVNPFDHSSKFYTETMRTIPLKESLTRLGFDGAIGGGRRDEEQSRAKERVFSFRDQQHRWDPRRQRRTMATVQHLETIDRMPADFSPVKLD